MLTEACRKGQLGFPKLHKAPLGRYSVRFGSIQEGGKCFKSLKLKGVRINWHSLKLGFALT